MNFHDFSTTTIKGKTLDLNSLKGKKVLIINTASECGYTPQYAQLEELYEAQDKSKVEFLAFPCDQFGNQEPGNEAEIEKFCQVNYGVTFPVMHKVEVIGENADPIFKWLSNKSLNTVSDNEITWNFQKFLINEDGSLYKTVSPGTSPLDAEIVDWLSK